MLIGAGLGLFSFSPLGTHLEEEYGLPILFKLRGSVAPPENVVIISIDEDSAEIMRLPDDPTKWPRSYYAELINKINLHQPALIAFNMTFDEARDAENDQLLAAAMTNGNNIILSNYIKQKTFKTPGLSRNMTFEKIINPIPMLDQAALGTAPFPLPKTSSTVKQFWAYKNSAGDIATFPVTIFQCYVFKQAYNEILLLLEQIKPGHSSRFPALFDQHQDSFDKRTTIHKIQALFFKHKASVESLMQNVTFPAEKKQLLNSWLNLLKKPDSLYFNYYGSAEKITTIPFYQALVSEVLNPDVFHEKIVLVGYSKTIEPEKTSGLYTVYSIIDNEITSPIEIAATAVANLIDNTWLKPLQPLDQFLLIMACSLFLSAIPRLLPYKLVVCSIILFTLGYIAVAYMKFLSNSGWLPLFIPVFIQVPLVLSSISIIYFLKGSKDHKKMQQAFSLYIPDKVVNTITQHHNLDTMNSYGELMQGICMATDAGQYTTLSESMDPQQLHNLINDYYAAMFPLVQNNKGIISDVVGDAMFAIWNNDENEIQARTKACQAALQIKSAVERFNSSQPHQLYTRLGLHFGNIRLGNVGAAEHYEYRAVGDTVNTASRIEGLNKLLGTQILVTAEVIHQLPEFITREIGFFILKGKTQAVHIYELLDTTDQADNQQQQVITEFSIALNLFLNQQWADALSAWLEIQRVFPGDGPTLFYIDYLEKNLHATSIGKVDHSQATIIKIGNITTPLHYVD